MQENKSPAYVSTAQENPTFSVAKYENCLLFPEKAPLIWQQTTMLDMLPLPLPAEHRSLQHSARWPVESNESVTVKTFRNGPDTRATKPAGHSVCKTEQNNTSVCTIMIF